MNDRPSYACRCCPAGTRSAAACGERRLLLGLLALAGVAPLAACSREGEGSSASTGPVEIARDTSCELDGMLLLDYPGPKGQIHYADSPRPVFYCDTVETLNVLLLPEQVRKVSAVYVQDMGKANWDNPQGAWIDARQALYVQGSKRKGSMGPTFATFSQEADAQAFIQEYGGKLLRMSEITPVMVDLRGGANLDDSM
ncbi:MAG: nitrous oxide reductase accessory protein NosL [Pseudomonadota bacterium]|nr:nitrous oxide reductase accessory protein NosL [Pseudomonadota bacterium]